MNCFARLLEGIANVISTVWGWICICFSAALTFFASEKYCFHLVFAAIVVDLIFGIAAAVHNKKFIRSKAIRQTPVKIASYFFVLMLVFASEKIVHEDNLVLVKGVTLLITACELWSISANILIIWPEAVFFKIFRRQLKGEIESKINKNIDDILDDK